MSRVFTQRGVTMAGRFLTSCRVISQDTPPAPTTIAARSTVTGTPASASRELDLVPRPEMRREVLRVLGPEATEVDDLSDASRRGGSAERRGCAGVVPLEVVVAERVHEVVGDVALVERRAERCRIVHVAGDGPAQAVVPVRVAGHRPHVVPGCGKVFDEAGADEAGGPGDDDRAG